MKIKTTQRKAAFVAAILASAVTASFSYAKPDQTQEKIRLMVAAVQARDAGDLKSSKQSLEELLKIAPNDEGVQRMLARNGVTLEVTPVAISYLADEGYDPEFGARPVKRVIHRLVLNRLSKDILAQKVDREHPIKIDAEGDRLIFSN